MTGAVRRLLAGEVAALIITVALVALVPLGPAPAAATAAAAAMPVPGPDRAPAAGVTLAENPALHALATCVRDRALLQVELLIDTSASLRTTDPAGTRVVALQSALGTFAKLATVPVNGRTPSVEVELAGFADRYSGVDGGQWQPLTEATLPRLAAVAESFRHADAGRDTDFLHALDGAQADLAAHAARTVDATGVTPCQALILFTDGEYSIEPRAPGDPDRVKDYAPQQPLDSRDTAADVVRTGQQTVCAAGGPIERLRSGGVATIAVALRNGRVSPGGERWLQQMADTSAMAGRCSSATDPPGTYLSADDLAELIRTMDRVANESGGATSTSPELTGVCPHAPDCTRTFDVSPGLRRFHLLVTMDVPGIEVRLRGPGGSGDLVLRHGPAHTATLAGAHVVSSWLADTALSVDADLPTGVASWAGTWSATFIDPDGTLGAALVNSQLFVYGDLVPSLSEEKPTLVRGERAVLHVHVMDQQGTPRTPEDLVAVAELRVTLTDPQTTTAYGAQVARNDDGTFTATIDTPPTLESSTANLTLTLQVTTRDGLALAPASRTVPVAVRYPGGPQPAESALTLSTLEGDRPARADVHIESVDGAGGCVWFTAGGFRNIPAGAAPLQLTTAPAAPDAEHCLRMAAGERRTVTVQVSAPRTEWAAITGTLVATSVGAHGGQATVTVVPLKFAMKPPVQTATAWLVFLGLLLAGIAVPIFLSYAFSWPRRWLVDDNWLRIASVPVVVGGDGALYRRDADGHPLDAELATVGDFADLRYGAHERSGHYGPLRFAARVSWLPFRGAYVAVSATGAHAAGSSGYNPPAGRRRGLAGLRIRWAGRLPDRAMARLPRELGGTWVVTVAQRQAGNTSPAAVEATLYLLLREPLNLRLPALVAITHHAVPRRISALAGVADEHRVAAQTATSPQAEAGAAAPSDSYPPEPGRPGPRLFHPPAGAAAGDGHPRCGAGSPAGRTGAVRRLASHMRWRPGPDVTAPGRARPASVVPADSEAHPDIPDNPPVARHRPGPKL